MGTSQQWKMTCNLQRAEQLYFAQKKKKNQLKAQPLKPVPRIAEFAEDSKDKCVSQTPPQIDLLWNC